MPAGPPPLPCAAPRRGRPVRSTPRDRPARTSAPRQRRPRVALLVDPRFPGGTPAPWPPRSARSPRTSASRSSRSRRRCSATARSIPPSPRALDELGLPLLPEPPVVRADTIVLHNPSLPEVRRRPRAAAERRAHRRRHPRELPAPGRRRGLRRRPLPRPHRRADRRRRAAARAGLGAEPRDRRRLARRGGRRSGLAARRATTGRTSATSRSSRRRRRPATAAAATRARASRSSRRSPRCARSSRPRRALRDPRRRHPAARPRGAAARTGSCCASARCRSPTSSPASTSSSTSPTRSGARASAGRSPRRSPPASSSSPTRRRRRAFGPGVVADDGDGVDAIVAAHVADPRRYAAAVRRAQADLAAHRPEAVVARLLPLLEPGAAAACSSVRPPAAGAPTSRTSRSSPSQLAALGVPARIAVGSVPEQPGLQPAVRPRAAPRRRRARARATRSSLARRRPADRRGPRAPAPARRRRPSDARAPSARFARAADRARGAGAALLRPRPRARALRRSGDPDAAPGPGLRRPPRRRAAAGRRARRGCCSSGRTSRTRCRPRRCWRWRPAAASGSTVLTDSRSKQEWIAAHGRDIPVFAYGEVPAAGPRRAHRRLRRSSGGSRAATGCRCSSPNLLVAGAPLLDGSAGPRLTPPRATPSSPAPQGLVGLDGFLDAEILPNLARIGEHVRTSRAAAAAAAGAGARLPRRRAAAPPAPRRRGAGPGRRRAIVFMPTNGVGLGHAQRCALIAGALAPGRPAPGLRRLPELHRAGQGARLRRDAADRPLARCTPRATSTTSPTTCACGRWPPGARALVFDGGYVFELGLPHRARAARSPASGSAAASGRQARTTPIALDREKAFDRVIVPEEAFEELNAAYSRGAARASRSGRSSRRSRLDAAARAALRADLAERYGRPFERLAVSLLGAGVAADRGAQIQALCGLFERRSDTLHLVARLADRDARARLVRLAQHAASCAPATPRCSPPPPTSPSPPPATTPSTRRSTTASPAIFVPQTGAFMDDQRARARAACDRGLAAMVEPHELMTLERLVCRYLDDGEAEAVRARLAAADLPRARHRPAPRADRGDRLWTRRSGTRSCRGSARTTPTTSTSCSRRSTRAAATPGRDLFPLPEAALMPEAALKRADAVCVGLRAAGGRRRRRRRPGDAPRRLRRRARRRDRGPDRGRPQRASSASASASSGSPARRPRQRAACEDQIRRFWNLDLVL